ncbi:fasciclin-like arabinogalactan protein 8 isoform X2 [Amborella trichopoda]|uniref:fasciclin-like arabinogalactan protein 8 isoform X2 n=1 Tax=Amborella trichopoda TaxID=13333 RepID=UPI0009BF46CC|nr:fasciclin-like arabinogalactan protein 8 isoform X2 [Amborella trichopoda]|eukprot:XP_020519820.1 fasciclin-like arabinogalactan protein 8 isoform X2 [Amborella trichopoda]
MAQRTCHHVINCYFLSLLFMQLFSGSSSFNITSFFWRHPDYTTFNNLLTATNVAEEIGGRSSLTILALSNSLMAPFISGYNGNLPTQQVSDILRYHVLLEYLDWDRFSQITSRGTLVTTLYQTTGRAPTSMGAVNITSSNSQIHIGMPLPNAGFNASISETLQGLTADKKALILKYHVLLSYYPLGSLQTILNPVQPTLATEEIGAGTYTLNITRLRGNVAVSSGIVIAPVTQTVFDQKPLAIFTVPKVLLPKEIFGSPPPAPVPAPPPNLGEVPLVSPPHLSKPPSCSPPNTNHHNHHHHHHHHPPRPPLPPPFSSSPAPKPSEPALHAPFISPVSSFETAPPPSSSSSSWNSSSHGLSPSISPPHMGLPMQPPASSPSPSPETDRNKGSKGVLRETQFGPLLTCIFIVLVDQIWGRMV